MVVICPPSLVQCAFASSHVLTSKCTVNLSETRIVKSWHQLNILQENSTVNFSIVSLKIILVPCVHRCYSQNYAQPSLKN